MSEVQVPKKQPCKRRSTAAMRETQEGRKRNVIGLKEHSTRSVSSQHADEGMTVRQSVSKPADSLRFHSPSSSSAQPAIEFDDPAAWDIEASIDSVRSKFSELNQERRRKVEEIEKQTLRDAIDGNLIRCCRCRSFAATDAKGSCIDCLYTRCSKCKHPKDLEADQ